jgi:Na+:H+ antiporter, NhaA family
MGIFNFFHSPEGEDKQHNYLTKLEEKLEKALTPFEEFAQSQIAAGGLLLFATFAALIIASIPWTYPYYIKLVNAHIGFHIGNYAFNADLKYWVNDILLTLFFFVIGLEIKREFLVGEFVNFKKATLVIVAAIGGMIIPVLIYSLATYQNSLALRGWGIPMATDTAFMLGILALFRDKFPKGLIAFMVAVAIVDDIGAILIIALFYTESVVGIYILIAALFLCMLIIFNLAGVRKPLPYLCIGMLVWLMTELSGVHGTIAGILIAFTIPARPKKGPKYVISHVRKLITGFELRKKQTPLVLQDEKQHRMLEEVQMLAKHATTPLQSWEHALALPVALFILPLFALTNAGIPLTLPLLKTALSSTVTIGIALALALGKPTGIISFCYFACKFKIGKLPKNTKLSQIAGAAILAGIGFTMSLFIADLSFPENAQRLLLAKTGILLGSLIAGILGALWLMLLPKPVEDIPDLSSINITENPWA